MPGECENCGGEVTAKDRRGWFRSLCWGCILDASIHDPPHNNPDPPEYK